MRQGQLIGPARKATAGRSDGLPARPTRSGDRLVQHQKERATMESSSFAQLLYRYWFYGWLFRDVNRGNLLERAAAIRYNRTHSRWLPTYLRRWTVLGLLCYLIGWAIEVHAPAPLTLFFFALFVLTVPVNAVTLAAWIGLKVMPGH
jgi:hypothetical protein